MTNEEITNLFRNRWVLLAVLIAILPLALEIESTTRDALPIHDGLSACAFVLLGLVALYLVLLPHRD